MKRKELESRIKETLKKAGLKLPEEPRINTIQNFFFTDKEVLEANQGGRLLMLDLDVGTHCDLSCGFCYVDTHSRDTTDYVARTTRKIKGIIDEGIELGLRVIKIVGAGEPFLYRDLFKILEYANKKGVGALVFTGGHIIGDDTLAGSVFTHEGVSKGDDLAAKLGELGLSVIVKHMTFDDTLQNRLVAPKNQSLDYARLRDEGLLRLIASGLNASKETRLGVDTLLLESNYSEAGQIFSLFNKYNIFVLMTPPVNCGGTSVDAKNPAVLTKSHALKAARSVYNYCNEHNIPVNPESPYFGGPPCSQLNHSMHIGDDNSIKACPGDNKPIGYYEAGNLGEVWKKNPYRIKYVGQTSHICPPRRGITLFEDLAERVTKLI